MSAPSARFLSRSVLISGFAAAAFLVFFYVWLPEPQDGDSICHTAQALHYRLTGELKNPLYNPLARIGANPEGRITWHGFLMPMLVGTIAPRASYPAIYATLGSLGALTVFGWAWFAARFLVKNATTAIFALAATWGLAGWYAGVVGRPETIALALVVGVLWSTRLRSLTAQAIVGGVAAGAALATSPQFGITFSLLVACYHAARAEGSIAVAARRIALAAATAVAALALLVAWYPFTLRDWIEGLALHSKIAVFTTHGVGRLFAHFWFIDSGRPLFALWFAVGFIVLWRWGRQQAGVGAGRWLFTGLFALAFVQCFLASNGIRTYNSAAFLPFALAGICWLLEKHGGLLKGSFASLLILTGVAPLAIPTLSASLGRTGTSYREARDEIAALKREAGSLTVSWGLFAALENHDGIDVQDPAVLFDRGFRGRGALFVFQQVHPYKAEPPAFDHYTLVKSHFTREPITLAGVPIAKSPLGWNFCVYQRKPDSGR